ncbi:MAG: branched-chain amino acid ABC transporter permease [Candidatus Heimdallarchaeota archaeon]|nr:MAG: branched-chain amino acid ABC transporter permease [Candidatus Heimdallarchaeota archaeon]
MKNLTKDKLNEYLQEESKLLIGLGSLLVFFLVFPFIYSFLFLGKPDLGLQMVFNGTVISVLYATLAMGFSLIYGIAKQLKLSAGGYYVIAAYTMYFLLEAKQIVLGNIPLPEISATSIKLDGLLILGLYLLPIIIVIIILLSLWFIFDIQEFLLMLISPIASGGGFILIKVFFEKESLDTVFLEGIYISLAVLLIGVAAWYLELSKREIAIGTVILGVTLPLLMFTINLKIVYIALMICAVMFTACLAMLSDRFLIDKVRNSHVNVLIVTFAVALFVQNFIQIIYFPYKGEELFPFGPEDRTLPGYIPYTDTITILGARIEYLRILSVLFSIVAILLLYAFIWFTKMGKALRAVAQDEEAAALAGIDIRKITAIVSGVGMGLIGFAAVFTSSFSASPQWSPYMGWWVLISCIAVVTLGGMGSLPGTAIAAFIIGFSEAIAGSMTISIWQGVIDIPINSLSPVIPFAAIALVLIFKPEGLLGTKEELE